jgi:CheY-like chemotaxis protein
MTTKPICLVVDDEPGVRTYISIVLQGGGFETVEAEHGVQALELLRTHPRKIDLIVSDVSMPKMNGQALAAAVRVEYPGTPILLISGYSDAPTTDGVVLMKPFLPAELLGAASRALGRSRPAAASG